MLYLLGFLLGSAIMIVGLAVGAKRGYKTGFALGQEHGKFIIKCQLLMGDSLDVNGHKFHLAAGKAPSLELPTKPFCAACQGRH